jgi:hypothetical protein
VYTTVGLEALLPEERRCPRCGAVLDGERRSDNRRRTVRRVNATGDHEPPEGRERRAGERRAAERRRDEGRTRG